MKADDIGIYLDIESLGRLLYVQRQFSKECSSCGHKLDVGDRIYLKSKVCEDCKKKDVILDNLDNQ